MKYVIVYCSTHGTTEKAAKMVKERLIGDVVLLDLKKRSEIDLTIFDTVIIGGSIHVGNVQSKVRRFISKNLNVLKQKRIGLFLCCMREGEVAELQFNKAFPLELREISVANSLFGGEFLVSKMNFIERQIVKKVSDTTENTYFLKEDNIRQFADILNMKEIA